MKDSLGWTLIKLIIVLLLAYFLGVYCINLAGAVVFIAYGLFRKK